MRRMIAVLLSIASVCAATSALGGEQAYKTGDIVAFFKQQKVLTATRGICVGSDEECAAADLKDHSRAFDLQINFEKNSAVLSEAARSNLIEFSVALNDPALSSLTFAVDGFTDASGGVDGNLKLSQRRAQSVAAFLRSMGVKDGMLIARGWGESNFRSDDALDPLNRRVETRILR